MRTQTQSQIECLNQNKNRISLQPHWHRVLWMEQSRKKTPYDLMYSSERVNERTHRCSVARVYMLFRLCYWEPALWLFFHVLRRCVQTHTNKRHAHVVLWSRLLHSSEHISPNTQTHTHTTLAAFVYIEH